VHLLPAVCFGVWKAPEVAIVFDGAAGALALETGWKAVSNASALNGASR
jgi:hypothetical protein